MIGVSTDSFFSHKAWFADRKTFPQEITHPVIADTNHAVSRAFGVLKEDQGVAYRATVIVDDKGIVRSVAMNDLSVGRSPQEVLRTVQALQSGGLCGADWKKGDKFVGMTQAGSRQIDGGQLAGLPPAPPSPCSCSARATAQACQALDRGARAVPRRATRSGRDVRFGKMLLDKGGLFEFKRASPWLAERRRRCRSTQIYVGGKQWQVVRREAASSGWSIGCAA